MTKTPDISVIIPAYNAEAFIGQCLDSIIRQDGFPDFEVIVVNDGSTDNTANIVQDYHSIHSNIRLITQKNGGVSVARNNAITNARGHFISFVDADDMVGLSYSKMLPYFDNPQSIRMHSDKLRDNMRITFLYFRPNVNMDDIIPVFDTQYFVNLMNPLRANNVDISFGGKITIDTHSRGLLRNVYEHARVYGHDVADKYKILNQADIRESANFALYRRKFMTDKKLTFLENMDLDEDMLFAQQAVLRAHNVATVSDATYLYNRRMGTLSNMDTTALGREHKFNLALVQRYSMLLNELRNCPKYSAIYTAFIKEFADPEHKMTFYSDCVPSDECGKCIFSDCRKCENRQINDALIAKNISDFIINQR